MTGKSKKMHRNEAIKSCNLRIACALVDEYGRTDASHVRKGVISTGVDMDQVEHVKQRPPDAEQERR